MKRWAVVVCVGVLTLVACGQSSPEKRSDTPAGATTPGAVFGRAPATSAVSITTMSLVKDGQPVQSVRTGGDGNYRIAGVDAGHYRLVMDMAGQPEAKTCSGEPPTCIVPPARTEAREFDLAAGEQHREDF